MGKEITVMSHLEELTEKKAIVSMELESDGAIRAAAKIIAVKVKDNM